MFTLTNIGLGLVCLAWIYQFVRSAGIDKSFRPALIVYSLGTLLVTIDGFINDRYPQAILRLIGFLAVTGVIVLSYRNNQNKK